MTIANFHVPALISTLEGSFSHDWRGSSENGIWFMAWVGGDILMPKVYVAEIYVVPLADEFQGQIPQDVFLPSQHMRT